MKAYTADSIRNIGIFGHAGEGKTTLMEAFLYNAGVIERMGKVEDGNTVSDYDDEEKRRGVSISTSVAPLEWKNTKINLVDAPGGFDFYGDVSAAMALCDSALIIVGSVSGVTVGAEKAMSMCKKANKPRMFVVNGMDRENANFDKVAGQLQDTFGTSVVPIQLPIMQGHTFAGYVNITNMKAYMFDAKGEKEVAIPADLEDRAMELREMLTEAAAETEESLMEKFFEEGELSQDEIMTGLCTGVLSGDITPVCCCAAMPNIGVKTLADNLVHYMPTAASVVVRRAVNAKTGDVVELDKGKVAVQVMKTVADAFVGKISIIRVFSGTLTANTSLYNSREEKPDKVGAISTMCGKTLTNVDKLEAGDIGAIAKLQITNTGDTLSDPSYPVIFDAIDFPKPCISLAISAKKQGEEDKVFSNLRRLMEEDPTIVLDKNIETGDMLIQGIGEAHIEVTCAKLKNKFKVEAQLSEPRVAYRETIRSTASAEGKHKKQTGGAGQFGVVQVKFEPNLESDYEFVDAVVGGVVPKNFIPVVDKGLQDAMKKGVLAGYPMVGIKATLYDGKYHPVDSKEVAFKSAARLAYKAGCVKASPVLIEPVFRYAILVPQDYVGDIMSDMSRRRGRVIGTNPVDEGTEVIAEAPASEMVKYATDLRSMTQGRGTFTMEFVRYEDVPANIVQKIIEQAKKDDEDDE